MHQQGRRADLEFVLSVRWMLNWSILVGIRWDPTEKCSRARRPESLQKVVARDEPVVPLSHHSLLMLSTCSYLAQLLAVNERLPLKPMPLLIVVQRPVCQKNN